jgi:hypothetical protein
MTAIQNAHHFPESLLLSILNHAHYHPGKPLCKCLSAKLAEALQQYVQGIANANPQPQVPNPAGAPAAVAPPIANPMQVAPVQNLNPIPQAIVPAQNVQNPPPIDNHETHNNEAPAEAKDQPPTDNNGVQALPPKVVDVNDDPMISLSCATFAAALIVTSILKKKRKKMMAKMSTTSTIPSLMTKLLKAKKKMAKTKMAMPSWILPKQVPASLSSLFNYHLSLIINRKNT